MSKNEKIKKKLTIMLQVYKVWEFFNSRVYNKLDPLYSKEKSYL